MNKNTKRKSLVYGIQAITEAIDTDTILDKVYVKRNNKNPQIHKIVHLLRRNKVPVSYVPVEKLNRLCSGNHQGLVGFISPIEYTDISNLIPQLFEQGVDPLLILLDGITDVRNLGAVARSAECAAIDAIILPEKNSATINEDAIKTSAGGILNIHIARTDNVLNTLKYLKNSGLQIVCASERAEKVFWECNFKFPTVVVIGGEDKGISENILKYADCIVNIPIFGKINSLNASVAASLMIYEVVRQRRYEK